MHQKPAQTYTNVLYILSCSDPKRHTNKRRQGLHLLKWEHEAGVPIYGSTLTGRCDTLTGRVGSPSRAANQWERERKEDEVNRDGGILVREGRRVWKLGRVIWRVKGWVSGAASKHSDTHRWLTRLTAGYRTRKSSVSAIPHNRIWSASGGRLG